MHGRQRRSQDLDAISRLCRARIEQGELRAGISRGSKGVDLVVESLRTTAAD